MESIIHQILLFLLLINFPGKIQAKNDYCPSSTCNGTFFPVRYPFKLKTDIPPKNCEDYINLSCNNQGQVLINIPASGDFIVNNIQYSIGRITLSDPGNCLPGRMMMSFSFYPLGAFYYDNYTYFTCPRKRLGSQFTPISCLSNPVNATIAVIGYSAGDMNKFYDCEMITTSLIPARYDYMEDDQIELFWFASGCKECEDDEYIPTKSDHYPGDNKTEWTKVVIPILAILAIVVFVACLVRAKDPMVRRGATNNTATSATTTSSTTIELPRATGDPPPETATLTLDGIENISKIKSRTEVTELLGHDGVTGGGACSICLEEYHDKVRVRYLFQCGHYFHVQCIDQWLLKNATCPVCRISL